VSQATWLLALARNRTLRRMLLGACALVLTPMLLASVVLGVFSAAEAESCGSLGTLELAPGSGPVGEGLYAEPLHLVPGRRYQVGATEYGGPGDPSSGSYGAIGDPTQDYLPSHPDTFAELSLLDHNPAQAGSFSFADANALGNLPYMTALRVWHSGRSAVLYKRDIGYGQGPAALIENGQPYRLDLWWRAALALRVSKSAVTISLAPPGGAAATLEALPETGGEGRREASAGCPAMLGGEAVPLTIVPGARTRILPSGLAAAGEEAPAAVRQMVAAGNRLHAASYLYGGGHGASLATIQPAYDCSSAVSYVLHGGGALGAQALDSGELAAYGLPGPGRYVTIYANADHVFMYVAGLRFDTVEDPAYDSGPNAGKPGPRWRVSAAVPGWASWVVRHPPGL
jgi:hypothetical protein